MSWLCQWAESKASCTAVGCGRGQRRCSRCCGPSPGRWWSACGRRWCGSRCAAVEQRRGIGVGNVAIEEGREEIPLARWRDHHERIADTDLAALVRRCRRAPARRSRLMTTCRHRPCPRKQPASPEHRCVGRYRVVRPIVGSPCGDRDDFGTACAPMRWAQQTVPPILVPYSCPTWSPLVASAPAQGATEARHPPQPCKSVVSLSISGELLLDPGRHVTLPVHHTSSHPR